MNRAGRVEFGADVFTHKCGGEFERTGSGEIGCERCGVRFTIAEWDQAQRREADEADERHRAMLGCAPRRVSERIRDAAAWN